MTDPREIRHLFDRLVRCTSAADIEATIAFDGYVIVPSEPTEAIIKAGMVGCTIPERWKAMLAAAKEPEDG